MQNQTYNKHAKFKFSNLPVRVYWMDISRREGKDRKAFCERCGRGMGKDYIYQELINFKGHKICPDCHEDKLKGYRNYIDIEDYKEETKRPRGYIPVNNRI